MFRSLYQFIILFLSTCLCAIIRSCDYLLPSSPIYFNSRPLYQNSLLSISLSLIVSHSILFYSKISLIPYTSLFHYSCSHSFLCFTLYSQKYLPYVPSFPPSDYHNTMSVLSHPFPNSYTVMKLQAVSSQFLISNDNFFFQDI